MAHNLDITNGIASFVSAREDAWHRLGTTLPDAFSAEDALIHGHLAGWNLRKMPVTAFDETTGLDVTVPDRFAILRDNPIVEDQVDALGVVGEKYQILQNEELVGLLDTLVDEASATFETAGAIDGGRQVFVTMKLPGHIKIGGVDPMENYIAATTAHDGSASTRLMVTPIRIVCQNTLNVATKYASNVFRVKHTKGATATLLRQAREALDFTFDYLDDFQEKAEQLINTELTLNRFEEIISREFGAPEDAPASTVTRSENKIEEMLSLFADAQTHEGLRDTAWAGFNALTEWFDHQSPVRGSGGDDQTARSRKALFDSGFKNRAWDMFSALV